MKIPRILFICKRNEVYSFVTYCRKSSGLFNSTRFVVEGLQQQGFEAEVVEVTDNNDIDREVHLFKPDIVILEALWVVPSKFPILKQLHPTMKWFVHMHSSLPFVALEGIAVQWLYDYAINQDVGIIANSTDTYEGFKIFIPTAKLFHLPNVYSTNHMRSPVHLIDNGEINVGCFGAIRPMKNQLVQALAAIEFANERDLILNFYLNSHRVETGGEPVLENIRALFKNTAIGANLIETPWLDSDDFINLLHDEIDIGMQVSMTETWNVVSCDYTAAGIPMVVSKEIPWASSFCQVNDIESVENILNVMKCVHDNLWLVRWNQKRLARKSAKALREWVLFVEEQCA